MRPIRLHDTRTGQLLPLRPRDPGRVGIYACGPTVYSRIHIGNARPFVVFSLLKRFLEHEGYEVTLVVNVTDVNDKIYLAARPDPTSEDPVRRAGKPSAELAAEMTARYRADTDALGLARPDNEPLASEMMPQIVDHICALIDSQHAYASGGDVFFSVRSDSAYGSLSHRHLDDVDQGEGIEGADRKRDPLDFALWKAHKEGEDTVWDPRDFAAAATEYSEWLPGRPGWHIECSAMAESLLGVGFDIHGGGSDLVFPHHENEAAQTRAARGEELARLWMHNGMIQLTGEKMAKSVGNIALLHEVLERCDRGPHGWDGQARATVIMYLIGGHYRQPLAFSDAELANAEQRVLGIREAIRRLLADAPSPADMASHRDAFFDALADDFNTPKALAALSEWVREANRRPEGEVGDADLREMLSVLGLRDLPPLAAAGNVEAIDPEATKLLVAREQARRERDFQRADRLREEIQGRGWEIRDGADGPELVPRS
ncbi:MAG TPA: cysteine--tRNA ligase [Solirubrobacteraceae bacterium]|jgi:cysteinyl-tRNA synthetase|nr:cysteine--tRNA ligase [Solirubrobacteraceae bacterium]